MEKAAVISKDGKYRHYLTRVWNDLSPLINFIMLNPSTGDAVDDDPTIRRCIGFAKSWGFGGIIITNLYDFRATDPAMLKENKDQAISKSNERYLEKAMKESEVILCAWGSKGDILGKEIYNKQIEVLKFLKTRVGNSHRLRCLGTCHDGTPRHPLYTAGITPMSRYKLEKL